MTSLELFPPYYCLLAYNSAKLEGIPSGSSYIDPKQIIFVSIYI